MNLAFAFTVFFGIATIAFSAMEVGFWLGHRRRPKNGDAELEDSSLGTIVAATLGLMAFLLAFTFGYSAERLDERRALVVEEANAIGTAELRARLLPAPYSTQIRTTLYHHAQARSERLISGELDLDSLEALSDVLLDNLWKQTQEATESETLPAPLMGLVIAAINDVIDLHTSRLTQFMRNRIPLLIWWTLGLIGSLSLFALGYQAGFGSGHRSWGAPALILAFCMVITLVIDLDRSKLGLITISQKPILSVVETLRNSLPPSPAPSPPAASVDTSPGILDKIKLR